VDDTLGYPLVAEPGDGFAYGPGIDWAGRLIEVLAGVSLEEYLQSYILAPLGAAAGAITFFPDRKHPSYARNKATLSVRDGGTGRAVPAPLGAADVDPAEVEHCMGGAGLFADMRTYMMVLESILADDERLLKKETARLLFEPLLSDNGKDRAALAEAFRNPDWVVGWTPGPAEGYSWSLAGLVRPGGNAHRGKRFLQWSGAYNLSWVGSHIDQCWWTDLNGG
jgi:CubicO group peptidase (beta-lactamase class C family)